MQDTEAGEIREPRAAKPVGAAKTGTPRPWLPRRRLTLPDLWLTLPFLLLYLVQLTHHQLWRDELQAFGLAASSSTIPGLLHLVHYEGHPWLWYLLLWIVSRVTVLPVSMKVLEGCIGIATYLLIGVGSPFSRFERVLLFLSYFVFFEYTVLSRMYGVMLLLALLYVRRRALQPDRAIGNAVLLGLLANSDMTGLLLSIGFASEFTLSDTWSRLARAKDNGFLRRRLTIAIIVFASFVAMSILSLLPAKDIGMRTTGRLFAGAGSLSHIQEALIDYTVLPYFPTFTGIWGHYWGALAGPGWRYYQVGVFVVLGIYWFVLRRHRNLLTLVGTASLLAIVFADCIYLGTTRHFGITFVAFIAALWLLRSTGESLPWVVHGLLLLSAAGGIDAGISSWRHPFSNAEATAAWLASHHYDAQPLVGTPDTSAAGVAILLRRPIYMLDCNCTNTFVHFSKQRDTFSKEQIPARLLLAASSLQTDQFLFIKAGSITSTEEAADKSEGFLITPLAQFTGAEAGHEDFYIYQFRRRRR